MTSKKSPDRALGDGAAGDIKEPAKVEPPEAETAPSEDTSESEAKS